jgi:hypothetical protein
MRPALSVSWILTLFSCLLWTSDAAYWMETIARRGQVTFRSDTAAEYPVFRNVKDFGAKGSVFNRILFLLADEHRRRLNR